MIVLIVLIATIMNITARSKAAKQKNEVRCSLDLVATPKMINLSKATVQHVPVPVTPTDCTTQSTVDDQSKESDQPSVSRQNVKDFTLNKDRCLMKKTVACDLPPIQIEIKDMGKQTVIR